MGPRLVCLLLAVWPIFSPAGCVSFLYGTHQPHGAATVEYMTGPYGTWLNMSVLEYKWNYYSQYATPIHPYNLTDLVQYSNGQHRTTCRDANGHLLCDLEHTGELDPSCQNFAYHEHNGARFIGDTTPYTPFNNFWFDDNSVARYMNQAYGLIEPNGLTQYDDFTRWQIVGGDASNWTPYSGSHYDQYALNGLYYLAINDEEKAMSEWKNIMKKQDPKYNPSTQQYDYPDFAMVQLNSYYAGLVKMLTDLLVIATGDVNGLLVQHSVSLRSAILAMVDTKTQQGGNLVNTETASCWTLGLGAQAKYSFEAGSVLTFTGNNYFVRPYYVVSAVAGLSSPGNLTQGPNVAIPTGSYVADFYLRAHDPSGSVAVLSVMDGGVTVGGPLTVQATSLKSDQWARISVPFNAPAGNVMEFATQWTGSCNVDVATVRVR